MLAKVTRRINSRIAYKLVFWVIVFSTVITIMTTAIQLYVEYKKDIRAIEEYFASISQVQLKTVSQAVWIMDDNQVLAQLDGITRRRDIIYAAIVADGSVGWFSGDNTANSFMTRDFELSYNHRGKKYFLGHLNVIASLDTLYSRLFDTSIIILLTTSLKTFLFVGCILFFFQRAVTRHLERLASHVVNMDFRRKLPSFKLKREGLDTEDEFSQVVNMLNIFQRRGYHAFNALEKSELRLRLFFDATEEGIFGINQEGRITFVNRACLEAIGSDSSQDIIGKRVAEIFIYKSYPTEINPADQIWSFTIPLRSGKPMSSDDGLFTVIDKTSFYAAVRSYPIISDEEITGTVIFFRDISEQREIQREKNLLSQAVRRAPLLIIIADKRGYIQYVNPGFEKLTGYSFQEAVGKPPYFLGFGDNTRHTFRLIRDAMRQGDKWEGVYVIEAKDGSERSLEALISPVINERGKVVNIIALCLDITQKLELQNQLNHAQKMEAVGRLSASFAHEFGNPLMGVRSVIKDISERVQMEDEDKQLLTLAYNECERMKILIRNFQQFQRISSGEKEYNDIHGIIDNVLFFYRKHFEKHDIELQTQFDTSLPKLFISKDQIAQVFLNLFINAVDAMANTGGVLTISTSMNNNTVAIDVKDTGVGIDEEDRQMIFEPFYTTKPEVQGTGLGLSISYGIVAGHGGKIKVASEVDNGAIFTVLLPIQPLKN